MYLASGRYEFREALLTAKAGALHSPAFSGPVLTLIRSHGGFGVLEGTNAGCVPSLPQTDCLGVSPGKPPSWRPLVRLILCTSHPTHSDVGPECYPYRVV